MTSTSPFPANCLPDSPVILQNMRILDPVDYEDNTGTVLIIDGDAYILAQGPLGEAMDANALPLPPSMVNRVRVEDVPKMDADGWVFGPGLVDLYSHSGEPGFESRETAATLAMSAIAGGFTRMAILPDTNPVLDTPGAIARLHQIFQSLDHTPATYFWGALTKDAKGQQMTELGELVQGEGTPNVVGLADSHAIQDLTLVQRILEYGHGLKTPIALFPQNHELANGGVAREGRVATQLGLPNQGAIAETTALSAILECVESTGTPVHIMRVSTARSVDLIYKAKEKQLPVTASTTWMHVLLNSYALEQYNPNLRIEPPLGNSEDQSALILALKAGILDAIAIDHTAYTYEEKTVPFALAPPGVIGLQCALPLLWQGLVEAGHFSPLDLWRTLSANPALCLGQTPPTIDSEWVLFNSQQEWPITAATLRSLSANLPWIDQVIHGQVVQARWR